MDQEILLTNGNLYSGRGIYPQSADGIALFPPKEHSSTDSTARRYLPYARIRYFLSLGMVKQEAWSAINFVGKSALPKNVFDDMVAFIEKKEPAEVLEYRKQTETELRSEDPQEVDRISRIWVNLAYLINKTAIRLNGRQEWMDLVENVCDKFKFSPDFEKLFERQAEEYGVSFGEKVRAQIRAWDRGRLDKGASKIDEQTREDESWTDPEYVGRMIIGQSLFLQGAGILKTDEASLGKLAQAGYKMPWGLMQTITMAGEIVEKELIERGLADKRSTEDTLTYQRYLKFGKFFYILVTRHREEFVGFRQEEADVQKQKVLKAMSDPETVRFLSLWPRVNIKIP